MLTIGARQGRYPGMAARRRIRIVWHDLYHPRPVAFDGPADETIAYSGAEVRMIRR
jgi:alpha-D-xyloside xylohydrolase